MHKHKIINACMLPSIYYKFVFSVIFVEDSITFIKVIYFWRKKGKSYTAGQSSMLYILFLRSRDSRAEWQNAPKRNRIWRH
jgi:hypothetical protein